MAGQIACFGELLLRMTAPGRELLLQRPHLDVHPGGAEANVAVALGCLGHAAKVISRVPDNALGRSAVGHLRRYGVDTSGVAVGQGRMGLYFCAPGAGLRATELFYDREASSFALAQPGDYDWDRLLDGADLLHLSGITPALGATQAAIALSAARTARARGLTISFDGNYRSQLWQRSGGDAQALLKPIVAEADILFGNHRDISLLLGETFDGDGPERRRSAALAGFDAFPRLKLIASTARRIEDADRHCITARVDDRNGCSETSETELVGIVERIGTGDAFAAGILHGVRLGRDLEWTVGSGLALACLKHSLPGDAALFEPRDVDAYMSGVLEVRR